MPELPEVETIRLDLADVLIGKIIRDVHVQAPKMVRGSVTSFKRGLARKKVAAIERTGKLLVIRFENDAQVLLLHLKMTGQLIYQTSQGTIAGGHSFPELDESLPNKHSHIVWHFTDGSTLFFNDVRKFGYVQLASAKEAKQVLATYGPEPLHDAFTEDALRTAVRKRRTALKNVLLNQQLIAGLGNIYVDEACFRAGVRPSRAANRVTRADVKKLHRAINHIIRLAIKHRGTTFNNYRDAKGRTGNFVRHLKVYGRAGMPCRSCGNGVKKTTIGGRGTHYCPVCQV